MVVDDAAIRRRKMVNVAQRLGYLMPNVLVKFNAIASQVIALTVCSG